MIFSSAVFILVFLPVVMTGAVILHRRASAEVQMLWLIAASIMFYAWWDWRLTPLLLGSVAVNFVLGLRLVQKPDRRVLWLGIALNLGLLGVFKYAGFFVETINAVTGAGFDALEIVLPLAISFFTFQQIAYLVDVYRGHAGERSLVRYSLFVVFFPQLIAGPIVHHAEMLPQFARKVWSGPTAANLAAGATIFAVGLMKKLAIADPLGVYVDRVYTVTALGDPVTFVTAWVATAAFGLQIYFDFSGYTDMALGLARMVGIRLPQNFASPYKAASIIDFWRRWHMTLSRFLRDYLYLPLGGSRRGPVRVAVNLMVVMVLGGLWHGASWAFVAWGALHGVYLTLNHAWRWAVRRVPWSGRSQGALRGAPSTAATLVGILVTFTAVTFAWAFFRAGTLDAALPMVSGLLGLNGVVLPERYADVFGALTPVLAGLGVVFASASDADVYPTFTMLSGVAALTVFVLAAPNTATLGRLAESATGRGLAAAVLRPNALTGAAVAMVWCVGLFLILKQSSDAFIYFQF
jgi:alginate O-acetyltransferase complex protein AlgI